LTFSGLRQSYREKPIAAPVVLLAVPATVIIRNTVRLTSQV